MIPGPGNALKASDLPMLTRDGAGRPTVESVASLALAFFQENRTLFHPDRGELVLNKERSAVLEDGRIAFADFDWVVDGVPVLGARVFARLNAGNLIQAGTHLIGTIDASAKPALTADEALARAVVHAGMSPQEVAASGEIQAEPAPTGSSVKVVRPGRLLFLPVADDPVRYTGAPGAGIDYRLVWEVVFSRQGDAPTWTARVDAHTGQVIEFFDATRYLGQVTGGVYPRTVSDQEVVWPFPGTDVTAGGLVTTDVAGRFPYAGGVASTGLDGRYFDTTCMSCTNPAQPSVTRTSGTGLLRFGTGGVDETGNGTSSRADRNAFYHLNYVRLVAKKWLSIGWLDGRLKANVNIQASCNAYYDGSSVNFFRSSSSCNNTGEISDVMQHEWGHGLDAHTYEGDGATGEATADTTAVHVTHSNLIGPYFQKSGAAVRNLDKSTTSKGLMTLSNVLSKCSSGSGPAGGEVHCEGEIYGQTTWDLAKALVTKYGTNTGWRESERIFFTSLPQAGTYVPNQTGSIYDAYIAVDDDDGNLANGTPNGAEIYAAFNTHGIAGTARTSTPHCARPAQPILTATPGCDQVALSWTPVPGATLYRVQKHWQPQGTTAFLNVAAVSGTAYVDTGTAGGLTYHYVVQAVNGSGCESSIETETLASPLARPRLEPVVVTTDDTPAGNRSGTVDPGESVDLTVTYENAGSAAADGVTATLAAATPGVGVTNASAGYPQIPAGGTGTGGAAYRIAIPGSLICGMPIDLALTPSGAGGSCPLEPSSIQITAGRPSTVRAYYDFEAGGGWTYDSTSSTAATGAWVRGAPVGTNYQPGGNATPGGSNCWYTAANPYGDDDVDDVDGGQVVLRSPTMNLTGMTTAHLSYYRWFGQRLFGDDPTGDFFTLEASNNGGATWTPIESLGDDISVTAWTKKEFAIENYLPLTATMRFRMRASDGPAHDDTIEAAIDEFKISDYQCDSTPPCFTPPSFAGLATAAPGPDCSQTDLSWPAATSSCQNAAITYNLYRDSAPGFAPAPSNRIASGLTARTLRDTVPTPGATWYYVARAYDSRSGEEANTVTRSVATSSGPDRVAPAFGGVGAAGPGVSCGETALAWPSAGESCSGPVVYRVHRSTNAAFTPSAATLVAETTSSGYTDAALSPSASYTYVVRARDGAGNEDANTVRATVAAASAVGGCTGCGPQTPVGRILLRKTGGDVVLDWTGDPVTATRYIVYRVTGPAFNQALRVGTTTAKSFAHQQAGGTKESIFYFVSAVSACGQESAVDTEP